MLEMYSQGKVLTSESIQIRPGIVQCDFFSPLFFSLAINPFSVSWWIWVPCRTPSAQTSNTAYSPFYIDHLEQFIRGLSNLKKQIHIVESVWSLPRTLKCLLRNDKSDTLLMECGKVVEGGSVRLRAKELLDTPWKANPIYIRICKCGITSKVFMPKISCRWGTCVVWRLERRAQCLKQSQSY